MSRESKLMENYPGLPSGYAEVKAGEWKTAQLTSGEDPLGTTGVYSCSVVAVLNVETARIYLGHFFRPHSVPDGDQEELNNMLKAIADNEDPVHPLDAWVGGASYDGTADSKATQEGEEVKADRQYVVQALSGLDNLRSINQEWLGDRESFSIVTFHPMRDVAIEFVREVEESSASAGRPV